MRDCIRFLGTIALAAAILYLMSHGWIVARVFDFGIMAVRGLAGH